MTTPLAVGDMLRDNDPRITSHVRILTVVAVLPCGVRAIDSKGRIRYYRDTRIFTDGKPRKIGFSRIDSNTP